MFQVLLFFILLACDKGKMIKMEDDENKWEEVDMNYDEWCKKIITVMMILMKTLMLEAREAFYFGVYDLQFLSMMNWEWVKVVYWTSFLCLII